MYRQIVGIPVCTNSAPLVADLLLFCYERDSIMSLPDNSQADVVKAFNSASYLFNIDNPYLKTNGKPDISY